MTTYIVAKVQQAEVSFVIETNQMKRHASNGERAIDLLILPGELSRVELN